MLNGSRHQAVEFTPPDPPGEGKGNQWYKTIDTSLHSPDDFATPEVATIIPTNRTSTIAAMTAMVLQTL